MHNEMNEQMADEPLVETDEQLREWLNRWEFDEDWEERERDEHDG